jgi:hypothetical protein
MFYAAKQQAMPIECIKERDTGETFENIPGGQAWQMIS